MSNNINHFSKKSNDFRKYMYLIYIFAKKELLGKYKQTTLGFIWAILGPILMSSIFMFVFSRIIGVSESGIHPIIFYMSGIIVWNFFNSTVTDCANTFINNSALLSKVFFPRIILPLSSTISCLCTFLIQFIVLMIVSIVMIFLGYEIIISPLILLFPVFVILLAIFSMFCGIFVASMSVKKRDFIFALSSVLQILFYCSPIIYSTNIFSPFFRHLYSLNPLSSFISIFRFFLSNILSISIIDIVISLMVVIIVAIVSWICFKKVEENMVDSL